MGNAEYTGWDGSSATGEALRNWRATAAQAGLHRRTAAVDSAKVVQCVKPLKTVDASHGGFDNDIDVVTRTLERITGGALKTAVDDLRGF